MRHHSALVKQFLMGTAATLLLALGARPSGAQVIFDDLDWTTDRGNIVFAPTGSNNERLPAAARTQRRAGQYPLIPEFAPLDSKRAVRRWEWPTTQDLGGDFGNPNPVPRPTSGVLWLTTPTLIPTRTGI